MSLSLWSLPRSPSSDGGCQGVHTDQAPNHNRDSPSGMDPTEAELQQISNLEDAMNWAGVESELQQSLMEALGQPSRVREIALIPRTVWDQAIEKLEIQADGQPAGVRRPTPVELARLESLRRVCNVRVGREADDTGAPLWAVPAVPGPPAPGLATTPVPTLMCRGTSWPPSDKWWPWVHVRTRTFQYGGHSASDCCASSRSKPFTAAPGATWPCLVSPVVSIMEMFQVSHIQPCFW